MLRRIKQHPDYRISDKGYVKSYKPCHGPNGYKLNGSIAKKRNKGYCIVEIERKRYGVHQLVLLAFVGPCPPGKYTRHKNGNRLDNRLTNLEWATPTKNNRDKIKHGTITRGEAVNTAILTERKVRKIKKLLRKGWRLCDLSRKFKVSTGALWWIKVGKNWAWVK